MLSLIDKKMFMDIRKEQEKDDSEREKIILLTRKVVKLSKEVIYALHRHDIKAAEKSLKNLEDSMNKATLISKGTKHAFSGSYKVAVQEYVEALSYYKFIKSGNIFKYDKKKMDYEHYVLGICDFTGELVRKALNKGIEGKFDEIKKIQKFVSSLYDELTKFDFRNGELRKKIDSLRWDLRKLEEIAFDLKARGKI